MKKELEETFKKYKKMNQPKSAYILPTVGEYTVDEILSVVKDNRYGFVDNYLEKDGFEPAEVEGSKIRFRYWYGRHTPIVSDTGEIYMVQLVSSIDMFIDKDKERIYIETSDPRKFLKAFSILRDPKYEFPFKLYTICDENAIEDLEEFTKTVNSQFSEFIEKLREKILKESGEGTNGNIMEFLRIKTVYIDLEDVQ